MNNPESIKIVNRFYEALDMLVSSRVLRGVKQFTDTYDINRWNLNTVRNKPESDMFQMAWLSYLIKDYGISAQWLMTGIGGMFGKREYPYHIDESKLKLSIDEIENLLGKTCLITYIPKTNTSKIERKLKQIVFDQKTKTPMIEFEEKITRPYSIKISSIIDIEEI